MTFGPSADNEALWIICAACGDTWGIVNDVSSHASRKENVDGFVRRL